MQKRSLQPSAPRLRTTSSASEPPIGIGGGGGGGGVSFVDESESSVPLLTMAAFSLRPVSRRTAARARQTSRCSIVGRGRGVGGQPMSVFSGKSVPNVDCGDGAGGRGGGGTVSSQLWVGRGGARTSVLNCEMGPEMSSALIPPLYRPPGGGCGGAPPGLWTPDALEVQYCCCSSPIGSPFVSVLTGLGYRERAACGGEGGGGGTG